MTIKKETRTNNDFIDSNKKRLKLICRDILNNEISRELLKAYANSYLNIITKNKIK